ncbi:LytTR family transcriptional regulator [Sphingobium sp. BYY-5]|uniref:LytTR family DNA-binding domain-containing protein n=1 Tax=Sphingobium sp. BYY-5 TaxID=2926400 RepID=UPI001FA6D3FD|nr:LytTR family DNA-binding domain-containing protein [Sphingobium sp. BYY-5]MCI4590573.1 LytTR family transcriptional regulator [Sphingobium sp. BYY-5]
MTDDDLLLRRIRHAIRQMAERGRPASARALRGAGTCQIRNFRGIFRLTYRGSGAGNVNWLRRGILELWAMVVLAAIVGFLGPFGTYVEAEFPARVWMWFIHLLGAYILVRPTIWLLMAIAAATSLPRNVLLAWGVVLASVPLALIWGWSASVFFQGLSGFAVFLPFAFLSAIAILTIVLGAKLIDEGLRRRPVEAGQLGAITIADLSTPDIVEPVQECTPGVSAPAFRLNARLGRNFEGPILALQSEDHYVRVHGIKTSELLLLRLRDAIAEMDDCRGQQVHRSWWVAQDGIASVEADGRNRSITLLNGQVAPVARESISILERKGFLQSPL